MTDTNLVITGSSGYLGSNFLNAFPDSIYLKRDIKDKLNLFNKNFQLNPHNLKDLPIVIIHLATHFSLDENDKELIKKANLDFGKELLKYFKDFEIKKIIYTNSMYSFYSSKREQESYYTKTKNLFSSYLEAYCLNKDIYFEEIYLDNTFGGKDKRKKILPLIIKEIHNDGANPIKNPENAINLMHVQDVISRLNLASTSYKNNKSSFIRKNSLLLSSIYEFLKHFKEEQKIDESILKSIKNNYIKNDVTISYENINVRSIADSLVETYLAYEG
jgi:nucleoside-diphosphate-sugar epimerase